MVATGEFLAVPATGGRQICFQIEGDAISYVWMLTFTTTWLVKNGFGRSAERKEDELAMKATQIVRRWLDRGTSGSKEIVVHVGVDLGALRTVSFRFEQERNEEIERKVRM